MTFPHKWPVWAYAVDFSKISQKFAKPKQAASCLSKPHTFCWTAPRPALPAICLIPQVWLLRYLQVRHRRLPSVDSFVAHTGYSKAEHSLWLKLACGGAHTRRPQNCYTWWLGSTKLDHLLAASMNDALKGQTGQATPPYYSTSCFTGKPSCNCSSSTVKASLHSQSAWRSIHPIDVRTATKVELQQKRMYILHKRYTWNTQFKWQGRLHHWAQRTSTT